jgi:spermidine dehydrogenase
MPDVSRRRSGPAARQEEEPYIFHFPDGNASVARLLVRALLPDAMPGRTMEDVVTAKADYTRLDRADRNVRIRLNSTVVSAKHLGDPGSARLVEVIYVLGGKAHTVRAAACVMACYNCMVPYLCPEMPETQKAALAYAVKEPLVYTNVQLRNWTAFQKLGTNAIYAPGSYFSDITLDFPVSLGDYEFPAAPQEPCVIHMLRTPCEPGLTAKEQYRAGRWELYSTPFATFEQNVRDQLGRMLAGGGFDPRSDIEAITVNRWPHGYAYEYNPLFEPLDRPEAERPCVVGRQPFGRIAIANSDSDGRAYTNVAIDQGWRAVNEIASVLAAAR